MSYMSQHRRLVILGVFFFMTMMIWVFVWYSSRTALTLTVLDVGQGDALLIQYAGKQILIDGGKNGAVLSGLGKSMPFWDRSLDVVIATHPDADHIGGLPDVLMRYDVGTVIESGNMSDTAVYEEFKKDIEHEGAVHIMGKSGTIIRLGDDAYLEILFPDRPSEEVAQWESNMASLVVRLVHGTSVAILTGDAPDDVEEYLVGVYGGALRGDVLKVGHHGSKTSTSPAFLASVLPAYAAISVGCDNTYGHPSADVVSSLKSVGVIVSSTCEEGTIVYESEGKGFVIKK